MASTTSATDELRTQWMNPGDIFSLLLIVGGDVVQKAAARLAGVRIFGVHLSPVAFSFGWVAYGFMTLASALGHQKLMPEGEIPIKVIDCDTGYDRDNQAWVLSRLLRDREEKRINMFQRQANPPRNSAGTVDSTGEVSLLIDIFTLNDSDGPTSDPFWWFCWFIIICQQSLGIAAWARFGSWSIFMITIIGTILSVATASLPQWIKEKWPSRRVSSRHGKKVALTRGNGHRYIMLILCRQHSWDLEAMAAARPADIPITRWILGIFAVLWVLLLITVTGIKQYTWFLIGVGGLGMLQNVLAAALPCSSASLGININNTPDQTIVGYRYDKQIKDNLKDNEWATYNSLGAQNPSDAETEYYRRHGPEEVRDVMGAIMELEKYHQKAGASLLPIFFPGNLDYEPGFNINREIHFWRFASTAQPRP